jgi:hypothetical protein
MQAPVALNAGAPKFSRAIYITVGPFASLAISPVRPE